MRILGELLLLVLGIAAVMVVARGLMPIAPALAGVLRALFHPIVLVLLGALFVLFRAGRGRRKSRDKSADDANPPSSRL